MDKFKNFPPVYCISLADSSDRRCYMKGQCDALGIDDITFIECYDGREVDFRQTGLVQGNFVHEVSQGAIATSMSHIKAIKHWLDTSNSEWAIFCEDDMIFHISKYWNFTWEEFTETFPADWECMQLSLIREYFYFIDDNFQIQHREGSDWSAGTYLLNRKSGQDIISDYIMEDGRFNLSVVKQPECIPDPESIIYGPSYHNYKAYVFPLFVENTSFPSTFYPYFIETTTKNSQSESSINVYNWWKSNGNNFKLKKYL
jgi:hypothetical protein